jgi:putative transposase
MKILKAYKFRLNPDKDISAMLFQHGGNTRFLWNQLVQFSNDYNVEYKKFPTQSILQKEIINIKKQNDFLKISHSQPLQINAQRLCKTNFDSIKPQTIKERKIKIAKAKTPKQKAKAINFGKPKFKSKHNQNDSIFYPQNFKIKKSRIFVSKIGWIPFIKHRNIEGEPLHLTIHQDGEQWYCSIVCRVKTKEKPKKNVEDANIVGIDVGVKSFATLSNNTQIENPKNLDKYLKKLKKEQKNLSRKQFVEKEINGKTVKVSSNNRIKQKNKVRKIHRKIKNIRSDFLHKITYNMIIKYDGFAIEKLDIKNMLKEGKKEGRKDLNRNISDVSWYEFGRQLEYKSKWYSKYFVQIDKYSPTTQRCSQCGNIKEMELKDRTYDCPKCGNHMDRDYNASINILNEGLDKLNAVASTVIKACGQNTEVDWLKQEKSLNQPIQALA